MAQVNWNSFDRDSSANQQSMRTSRLTEGERLHEQALAFYAHGNLPQADLCLNKAIALEPLNNSFRETRHFFSELASSRNQSQRAAGVGCPYTEAELPRRQFNRNAAPHVTTLPRQTWESRRPPQHCPRFLGPNQRGPCPQPVNGNQYFSNTVADSMFGPSYWVPPPGVQNLSQQESGHIDNPRPIQRPNNSYSVGRNFGPQHGTTCHTSSASKPVHLLGEWSEGVKPNSSEESLWDSTYQQSDIPWTQDSRKEVSQSNGSRSSANCSASQGSYRGSMANSARDVHSKVGRCSEETNSLDSFEESTNKVQEWLVKNDTSGVLPPPGFEKLKKSKKKKKKKLTIPRKDMEPQKMDAFHLDKREQLGETPSGRCENPANTRGPDVQDTSCQQNEFKTSQMNNASYLNMTSPRRTAVPLIQKPLNNCNPALTQTYENSIRSESSSANAKPFFDPKRIFTPSSLSNGSGPQGKTVSERTYANQHYKSSPRHVPLSSKNTTCGQPGNAQMAHRKEQNDQNYPRNSSASSQNRTTQQQTEIGSPAKGMNGSRSDCFNCPDSDTSTRVIKDEWNDIISRMSVPLGYPSQSPEHAMAEQCSQSTRNSGFGVKNEGRMKSSSAVPFRYYPEPQMPTYGVCTSNLEEDSKAARTYTDAGEEHSPFRQTQFINVKSMAGKMETCTPVCRAATNTLASRGVGTTAQLAKSAASQTTESTQKTRPSCPTPLAKESSPSESGNSSGGTQSYPTHKPKERVPPLKEPNTPCVDRNHCEETRSGTEGKDEVAAEVLAAQTAKVFWEPARIFGVPRKDRKIKKVKASDTGVEQSEKADCNHSPLHQPTTGLKKDPSKKSCEDPQRVSRPSTQSNQEVKKTCTQTDCTQTTSTPLTKSQSPSTSDCLNDVQKPSKAVPSSSSTDYSYVAWRDLGTQNDKDSVKMSSPENATLRSNDPKHNTTGAAKNSEQPEQDPAGDPTKFNNSQSSEKASANKSDSGSKQNRFKYETVPEKTKTQQREFSKDLPSNVTPEQKPGPSMRRSSKTSPEESKSKPSSAAAPPKSQTFKSKPEGTNSTKASRSDRPSAQSNSRGPQTGASQGTRNKPSNSGASARTPGSSEGRSVPRERSKRQEATSQARESQDELEIEDVDPWYKWTRAIGQGLWWAVCFVVFLMLILLACLYSTLKFLAKYCWHIVQELWKVCQESRRDGGQGSSSQGQRSQWSSSSSSSGQGFGAGGSNQRSTVNPTESIDIPTSGDAAIKRLLRCNADNPYEVLGVSSEASDEDIKKYYRKQCMLVHPDKNDLPNAQTAFQMLQKAYDTLTDPVKKREFEMESRHAPFEEEMEDFVKKMEEVLNTLSCDVCHGKHRRYETDRNPFSARYCRRHDVKHPAYEGDVWVETSHLGFKWHYFAMMEDRIFDITEWAACQDMRYMEANACEVRYHVGTRGNRNSSRQRHQSPNTHGYSNHHSQRGQEYNADMTEELLKEFLRQFQQGEARGGVPRGNPGPGGVPRGTSGGGDASNFGQERSKRHKKHRKKKR